MKKPGLSVGSIVMMLVTAFVVVGMAAFLNLIAGDDVYERTRAVFGNLAEQTAERETAEPTVSPTKTPFFEATAEPTVEPTPTATPDQSPKTITIAAAGTIYAPKAVRESAQEGMDHYDFTTTFEGLSGALAGADLSVVTLETTLAGREKGYGNYNTSPQLLDALRAVGVNFVSLATERALDKGYDGLDITASELTSRSMGYAGVYPDGVNTGAAMLNVGGVQVAVLAYAYGLSDEGRERTKGDSRGVVALMETQRVTRDIAQARVDGANIVVVLPHWGTKNRTQTPDTVHAMAERMARIGGVNIKELGRQLFSTAGGKSVEELVSSDFKEFHIGEQNLGVGQVTCLDSLEMLERKEEFLAVMRRLQEERHYNMVILMLTDVLLEGTQLLYVGSDEAIRNAFSAEPKDNALFLPGVMSRKKQVIPMLSALWG